MPEINGVYGDIQNEEEKKTENLLIMNSLLKLASIFTHAYGTRTHI